MRYVIVGFVASVFCVVACTGQSTGPVIVQCDEAGARGSGEGGFGAALSELLATGLCTSDEQCYSLPMACVGEMLCTDHVCVCTGIECIEATDCPSPPAPCMIPVCIAGACDETEAPDGTPCIGLYGSCEQGSCKPNLPSP